jgi:hypothetical protein
MTHSTFSILIHFSPNSCVPTLRFCWYRYTVYLCVSVRMFMCMHVRSMFANMHVTYVCEYACYVFLRICMSCMFANMHVMYVCEYACYVCLRICMSCMFANMHVMYVCEYACYVCLRICMLCMFANMHVTYVCEYACYVCLRILHVNNDIHSRCSRLHSRTKTKRSDTRLARLALCGPRNGVLILSRRLVVETSMHQNRT